MDRAAIPTVIDWGVAQCSLPGEAESGDASIVAQLPDGALIAVIDGLGHGPEAADAASAAVSVVKERAGEPLKSLIEHCHQALRYSRGAAMTLAQIDSTSQTLTWLGVGNVEGRLLRARPSREPFIESPMLRGGILGHKLPRLHTSSAKLFRGDLIVMTTDGITGSMGDRIAPEGTPEIIAGRILEERWAGLDDALVLVARYLGGAQPHPSRAV